MALYSKENGIACTKTMYNLRPCCPKLTVRIPVLSDNDKFSQEKCRYRSVKKCSIVEFIPNKIDDRHRSQLFFFYIYWIHKLQRQNLRYNETGFMHYTCLKSVFLAFTCSNYLFINESNQAIIKSSMYKISKSCVPKLKVLARSNILSFIK